MSVLSVSSYELLAELRTGRMYTLWRVWLSKIGFPWYNKNITDGEGPFLKIWGNGEYSFIASPVSWSCRIHQLHLCKGVRPLPNECSGMTLNHLMERLQPKKFSECRVPLYCHYSQVHFYPERNTLCVQIKNWF